MIHISALISQDSGKFKIKKKKLIYNMYILNYYYIFLCFHMPYEKQIEFRMKLNYRLLLYLIDIIYDDIFKF